MTLNDCLLIAIAAVVAFGTVRDFMASYRGTKQ